MGSTGTRGCAHARGMRAASARLWGDGLPFSPQPACHTCSPYLPHRLALVACSHMHTHAHSYMHTHTLTCTHVTARICSRWPVLPVLRFSQTCRRKVAFCSLCGYQSTLCRKMATRGILGMKSSHLLQQRQQRRRCNTQLQQ